MKENYKAWDIDYNDFYNQESQVAKLRFLIRFAVLAPSSHNSQPWKFLVQENRIILMPDLDRSLPISDGNHRQLFISLGCALENILIAADYYRLETSVEYVLSTDIVVIISFTDMNSSMHGDDKNHLIFSIPNRYTNRNKYTKQLPGSEFLKQISNFSNENIKIDIISDQNKKEKIADITVRATVAAMDDKGFREELSHYIKSNITTSKTGMPAFGFGMPTLLSFIASKLLKHFNVNKLTSKQDKELLAEFTPVFVIISTRKDDKKNWVQVGQLYEKIAIEARQNNMHTAPMASPIQIDNFYKDFQEILSTSFRSQFFFRIGYSKESTIHSPRLTSINVTV